MSTSRSAGREEALRTGLPDIGDGVLEGRTIMVPCPYVDLEKNGVTVPHVAPTLFGKVVVYACASGIRFTAKCDKVRHSSATHLRYARSFFASFQRVYLERVANRLCVTKESGTAGGLMETINAAKALDIPLIIIRRPKMDFPVLANDFQSVLQQLKTQEVSFMVVIREDSCEHQIFCRAYSTGE